MKAKRIITIMSFTAFSLSIIISFGFWWQDQKADAIYFALLSTLNLLIVIYDKICQE